MSSVVYTAQAENTDVHLKQLVECMDNQDFECAVNEIPRIKNKGVRDSIALVLLDSLHLRTDYYRSVSNYDSCVYYQDKILSILEGTTGSSSFDYIAERALLGLFYLQKGDFRNAISSYEKAIHQTDESNEEEEFKDMLYDMSFQGLGMTYYMMGEYDRAEMYYLKSLAIMEEYYGKGSKEYYTISNSLFYTYHSKGDFKSSIPYGIINADYCRTTYGENSLQYAMSISLLSVAYFQIGSYVEAEPLALKALELYHSLGENDYNTLLQINENLGAIYSHLGNYKLSEQYMLHAIDLFKSVYGESHPQYPQYLVHLGTAYKYLGDVGKAESQFLEAIRIAQEHNDSITLFNAIFELAESYQAIGLYDDAQSRYNESIGVLPSEYKEDPAKQGAYAKVLNSLAGLYSNIGKYEEAEQYYLRTHRINYPLEGEKSHNYGSFCNNMGLLYLRMKKFEQAETYFLKALETFSIFYNDHNPIYLMPLNNLGLLYYTIGDYEKAEYYYTKVLKARNEIYVEYHPDYLNSVFKLGQLKSATHKQEEAFVYFYQYIKNTKEYYVRCIDFMSEVQRRQYWNTIHEKIEKEVTSFLYNYAKEENKANSFAYDNELFVKGLLLSSANAIKNSVLASGDTTLIRQWNELTEKKQQIIALEEKDPQSDYLTQVKEEAESLEKEITRKSAAYRENMRQWAITWDSVRATLKPNQVAIEYMRAPLNEDSTMYCALLLRDTCSYPIMIPLFEEKEVSALLHQSTANKENINPTYTYGKNGKQLSQHIWSRVMPYLNEGETVFFSPTGILHQLAIENLPFTESNTMGDRYNLVRLSSTRELAMTGQAIPHQTATLYGGILYDPMDTTIMIANATRYRSLESTAQHTSSTDTIQRSMALYLPGSKAEIDSIQPILAKKKIAVTVYSKDTACEESFKAQSGKQPNILLLSTHGFFWKDSTARQERYFRQRAIMQGEDDFRAVTSIDPLERCGLLFAGANTALSGHSDRLPQGVDDGILTAKEISVLDFRKTDIVVMSACETGLGDISGEGVFGLQRAFKMAGAKTIMMTLWQVNDRATNLFMTSFFRHYSQGMSKRQAFRLAQQEVRNYTGEGSAHGENRSALHDKYKNKGKIESHQPSEVSGQKSDVSRPYASPYYWAGFILLD